jgi:hypothetical protein
MFHLPFVIGERGTLAKPICAARDNWTTVLLPTDELDFHLKWRMLRNESRWKAIEKPAYQSNNDDRQSPAPKERTLRDMH